MKIIDSLAKEHRLIDEVSGSLLRWAFSGWEDSSAVIDRRDLVRFLRGFVLGHHHSVEEVLFVALADVAEVPANRGPLAVLRREHAAMAASVDDFESATPEGAAVVARELAGELRQHLDKENSVLLRESQRRLVDGGLWELELPPFPAKSADLWALGEDLVTRLPPADDEDTIRGDGCIPCPSFAVDCRGIEAEWWSDWERSHYAGLDEG
ncbi:MAG: hemerythrin domain-containing protein [Thermoanaerobaculales bacterium]|jgi:hemerythrin-like domain-containing protein|nr:hemerythrin domain-containing protein [Thermoanaerobaculales bacterium]